ncbi:PAS domain-containing protein [Pseudomonas capeferrum]|uniref:PAS domain-containing protein n=1 Tax=Pseudomonas capeferrum TaxID=1495066 RepID=UPI0015E2C17A|nr:PAS domain-containing protein [Pseudomonas capeferrum]MBA1200281.1 PAS domain-containing protein [Pseudomonas capeferrum]
MTSLQDNDAGTPRGQLGFLLNGGSIGTLLRTRDWADSHLGAPQDWSPSLKILMGMLLPSQAQIVLFWGPQYVALYNDTYAPTIGAKHPRALGRSAVENWSELWDDLEPLLRNVRETGETFSAKDRPFYIERHGQGETAYFDVSYSAVREADGEVAGVLCIVTETTERVRYQRRQAFLLELGQALPTLGDSARIETYATQRLGRELGASRVFFGEDLGNGTAFRIGHEWSNEATSMIGDHAYQALGDDARTDLSMGRSVVSGMDDGKLDAQGRVRSGCASSLRTAATLHVPILRSDRLEALLGVHFQPSHRVTDDERLLLEESAKQVWAAMTHARDQHTLRTSSMQLSAMFEQASAGIALCDRWWNITRVNDRYCEMVGRPRAALIGTRLPDVPVDLTPDARRVAVDEPSELTQRYRRPDGSQVWVQSQITPLVHEHGRLSGMLCVSIDITARIQAEAELVTLSESLEERVAAMLEQREASILQLHEARRMEMIGQLSGGIAHDFNNMLTPIITTLELVRRRQEGERSAKLIDSALQAADRARNLVGRLLSFARRQTLKPQAVSLAALVADMHELMARSLGPGIEIIVEIDPNLPAVVVDPHQLELAILNLVVNARDAMANSGRLTLRADTDVSSEPQPKGLGSDRQVWLQVGDSGTGMSEEVLKRCMEPFYSTKRGGKGTGLGLSMVQGLAAQSGGGLSVDSTPGQGTQATIWLPASDGPAHAPIDEVSPAPPPRHSTHVLLVDDEDIVRHATGLQLRDLGYEVTEASSAAAAQALIDTGLVVDILVTDHIMNDMTGAQFAQSLRQSHAGLPVLIITGYANLTPLELQGFEVLRKPFRRAELAQSLAQLLSTVA